jgi:hypothetical protein
MAIGRTGRVNILDANDTFKDEVFNCDGTCLVETTDVHATSKRNTEGLGTKDSCWMGSEEGTD